jgi:hypothetical protein
LTTIPDPADCSIEPHDCAVTIFFRRGKKFKDLNPL